MALTKPIVLDETAQESNRLLAELVALQKANPPLTGPKGDSAVVQQLLLDTEALSFTVTYADGTTGRYQMAVDENGALTGITRQSEGV